MDISVRIPTPLQKITKDKSEVPGKGRDIKELIENLENDYPGMKERLYDEKGNLRRFINIYVNEEDIRFLKGDETEINDGDEISIIPAIAGGAGKSSSKKIVKLTFPQELIKHPLTFQMANKYNLMPNIRRAKITESTGEIVLEIEGTDENIEKGLEFLKKKGVIIEPITGDIVE